MAHTSKSHIEETLNIKIKSGEYYPFSFDVTNDNFTDFTGWSAESKVKKNYSDSSAQITVATSSGEITLSGNTCEVEFPSSKTGIEAGRYVWDLKLTDPDGNKYYPYGGEFIVDKTVTT